MLSKCHFEILLYAELALFRYRANVDPAGPNF